MTVCCKSGQLLLELDGVALGTLRFLLAKNDSFKLVAALSAKILENWHVFSDSPHLPAAGLP